MEWSPQQIEALGKVNAWLNDPYAPRVFRLFGYAGTGKTTLAKEVAAMVGGLVLFATFTGKASLVLRKKGCHDAQTIHSLIYKPEDGPDGKPIFVLNVNSPLTFAKLLIVDEVSMVGDDLGADLMAFNRRVLVLGDPAQLPPVNGMGYFTAAKPDILLTEIHRQAAENPLIRMSMDIRQGGRLHVGENGPNRVMRRMDLKASDVLAADQVLVGKNSTRKAFNARIRELRGFKDPMPMVGERLVCLRNNKNKGLLNGGLWDVENILGGDEQWIDMYVRSADGINDNLVKIEVRREFFTGTEENLTHWERKMSDEFFWGYALTVHKAQGSEWPNVMLFDESGIFREDACRWLYTGVTRASERITVVI